MKINIVVNSFPNTSETFLFNLVVELEKKGHDITVCAFTKKNNAHLYKDQMHQWSGKIVYMPTSSRMKAIVQLLTIFQNPKALLSLLRKRGLFNGYFDYLKLITVSNNRPQIIHFAFSGIAVNLLPILDFVDPKTKLFVSCRGTAEKITPIVDSNRSSLLSNVLSKMDRIHCVSEDMRQSLIPFGLLMDKSFVNHPSINTLEFKPLGERLEKKSDDIFTIITTGRLNYIKGYIYAIGAIANLLKNGYKIQYHIIGDGPDFEMLNYFIRERELQDSIVLIGKVSATEVNKYLQQADIFLLPSISEGISNAALEALSLEIPTISTDAGGMKEVIQNGNNGLLIERFSEIAIENAITHLIQNHSEALSMGKNGRKTVNDNFTLTNQINIFEHEYNLSFKGLNTPQVYSANELQS